MKDYHQFNGNGNVDSFYGYEVVNEMERDKDFGSGSMPRSYPSIRGNPSEILSVEYYGISKGKEQYNAVRAIRRSKIQIPQPRILV